MTDEEIKEAYLEWVKVYCNNDFEDSEELPGGVKLALEMLLEINKQTPNVSSESVEGLSRSFAGSDIPANVRSLLRPYRRGRFL